MAVSSPCDWARREARGGALEGARTRFEELSQRLGKFEDSLDRTVLRAPVDGIVKTIYTSTIGGVVQPGSTVIDIVPLDDTLIVEAQLPTQDIGYVSVGQLAVIRLNSPELSRFGSIDGRVIEISPDKLVRDDGLPYYRIRLGIESDRFTSLEQEFRLFPGTQVMASILTGQQSVLEYFLGPFLGAFRQALQER